MTGGGTESLLLAVKAARDAHPSISGPELVLPSTAHAAFVKAASYLAVRPVPVRVSRQTLRPDPEAVAGAITDRTVLVARSAPPYAHGVIDPVPAIAAADSARGVRCHVDGCFGGWVLPFLRRLGVEVAAFDFSVTGITSTSVDVHSTACWRKRCPLWMVCGCFRRPDLSPPWCASPATTRSWTCSYWWTRCPCGAGTPGRSSRTPTCRVLST